MASTAGMVAMAIPAAGDGDRARNQRSDFPGMATDSAPDMIVDAGWIDLNMGKKGQSRGPFEVSSSGPLALTFTDMACPGDRMQALDGHE